MSGAPMTQTTDLEQRLRRQGNDVANSNLGGIRASLLEAADELARLRAENERLRDQLKEWR